MLNFLGVNYTYDTFLPLSTNFSSLRSLIRFIIPLLYEKTCEYFFNLDNQFNNFRFFDGRYKNR